MGRNTVTADKILRSVLRRSCQTRDALPQHLVGLIVELRGRGLFARTNDRAPASVWTGQGSDGSHGFTGLHVGRQTTEEAELTGLNAFEVDPNGAATGQTDAERCVIAVAVILQQRLASGGNVCGARKSVV